MIRFNCPSCGHGIQCDDKHAGKRAKCPRCAEPVAVPGGAIAVARPKPLEPVAVERVVVAPPPAPVEQHAPVAKSRWFGIGRKSTPPPPPVVAVGNSAPTIQQVVHVNVSAPQSRSNSAALVSLICGAIALCTFCLPPISVTSAGFGILFACLGILLALLNRGAGFGMAIAGGLISCVALWPYFALLGLFGAGTAVAVHQAATMPPPVVVQAEEPNDTEPPAVEQEIVRPPLPSVDDPGATDSVVEPMEEPTDESISAPIVPVVDTPPLREQWRTWTRASDGRTLEGKYSGYQPSTQTVMIVKRDGSIAKVPLDSLSEADRQLVSAEVEEK